MNQTKVDRHYAACRSAATTTALEAALARARAELTEVEYWMLLARLSGASNEQYEASKKADSSVLHSQ